jgi:NAD(P)-dependent dehydrogenase (short-subunit alcohol dehydrogenase family)
MRYGVHMNKQKRTVWITGANRGIGLEFVKQCLANGDHVIATYRSDQGGLKDFSTESLTLVSMDVTEEESVSNAFSQASHALSQGLDVLINNAGRSGATISSLQDDLPLDDITTTFHTNVVGPMLVAKYAHPFLMQGQAKKLVNISSKMGSIQDNDSGASYMYRISKTAVNMLTQNMAHDFADDDICVLAFHPGWVQTDMGGPNALITPEESVKAMLATIDQKTQSDSGGFFERTGEKIPY